MKPRPSHLGIALALVLAMAVHGRAQFFARRIVVSAARSSMISGQQMPLAALARDENGATSSEGFEWGSSDEGVASVDRSGVVTARGIGMTDVWVTMDGAWTSMRVQVLPARVEIRGGAAEAFAGVNLQFTAVAIDISGAEIPHTDLEWDVAGPNGFYTNTAYISDNGLLYTEAAGPVTVRATLNFWGSTAGQVERLVTSREVVIRRRQEFRLTRLLATDPVERAFEFLPDDSPNLAANDAGQLVVIAPLDGVTSGLMRYDNGSMNLLASAGTPGVFTKSIVWGFEGAAIDSNGRVLSKANTRGNYSSLILASAAGSSVVLAEGQTQGTFQAIRNFTVTRYSLNDRGDIVFRGTYDQPGGPWDRDGIFKLADGELRVVWGVTLPLAEFPDGYDLGVDGNGVGYFMVRRDSTRALYRADGSSAPQKVLMSGDSLGGSTVGRISDLAIAPNGTLAFRVDLDNGVSGPVLHDTAGNLTMLPTQGFDRVTSVNDSAQVVFNGSVGDGWGFVLWDGDTTRSLISWDDSLDGGKVRDFRDAIITPNGTVYAAVSTTLNGFIVLETGSNRVLFKGGDRFNLRANLNFLGFVPGALSGPPYVYAGGDPASVFGVSASDLIPVWKTGDEVVGGNLNSAVRSPRGDLYLAAGSGVFRNQPLTETLLPYPSTFTLDLFRTFSLYWTESWFDGSNYLAANDTGTVVWRAWSDEQSRLVSMQNGRLSMLASFGGEDQTQAPSGGSFDYLMSGGGRASALALDESGRVMIVTSVRNGPDGIFVYENGHWQTAALFGETRVGGGTVGWVDGLRAVGGKFFALMGMETGGAVLAEYVNQQWQTVIRTGDTMPNGAEIFWVDRNFDVNTRGDIAFVLNTNGGTEVALRTSDGTLRTVYRTGEATAEGDYFWPWQSFDIDLRDDGSLYFIGIDLFDRNVMYHAEPLF